MSNIEIVKTAYVSSGKKGQIPVTVEWKGERMIRGHSLQSSVREIVRMVQSLDVVKINVIGQPGSGKTTFALALSCLIHQISEKEFKVPFAVKHFSKDELLEFEKTLSNLEAVNWILIFDDVSFLNSIVSKHKIEELKQRFTEIRHIKRDGIEVDVKIITIFITHYTLAMTKYLRQSQFAYYTSIGSSEFENMVNIVGNHYTKLLLRFQKICASALTKGKFTFNLGSKSKFFTYRYRDPFIPLLFHDQDHLRVVVSPKREWLMPFCTTCTKAQENQTKDGKSVKEFTDDLEKKFGSQIARNAVRIKLLTNGLNVYPKSIKYALTYIDKHVKEKLPNLQELADHYGFSNDRTVLNAKYTRDLKVKNPASPSPQASP